jgi:predicted  nucleic acid-binding Zn-ribbon protein
VVSVREELAGYVALQRLLEQRATLRRELETPPAEVISLRTALQTRQQGLGGRQSRRAELVAEQEALQRDLEALREEREHFRRQKSQVTNMRQLSAVVSELDHVESQLKGKEDRLLEVMQELETLEREIAELGQEPDDERARREAAEAHWESRRRGATGELESYDRRLNELKTHLGEASLSRFRKLWASRKPNAVVPIDGHACSACHSELRPSLLQQVRTLEALSYCDSCRRLLYDPEQFSG